MKYTVNISRARTKGRNKRAKKAVSILREELENIEDREVSISQNVNQKIWERGARKPPRKITVEVVEEGERTVAILADEPREQVTEQVEEPESEEAEEPEEDQEAEQEETEEETAEEETEAEEEAEEQDVDEEEYEEILSGSVSDAKDAIKELDDPDYEELLKLEEEGKDRKTMKEWLENQQ